MLVENSALRCQLSSAVLVLLVLAFLVLVGLGESVEEVQSEAVEEIGHLLEHLAVLEVESLSEVRQSLDEGGELVAELPLMEEIHSRCCS